MCELRAAQQAGTEPGRFWEAARAKEGTQTQESEKLHQRLKGLHSHVFSSDLFPRHAVGFEPTLQGRSDDRTLCSGEHRTQGSTGPRGCPGQGQALPSLVLGEQRVAGSDWAVLLLSRLTIYWNREQALPGLTISLKNKEN